MKPAWCLTGKALKQITSRHNQRPWPSAFIVSKSPWNRTVSAAHTVQVEALSSGNISLAFDRRKKGKVIVCVLESASKPPHWCSERSISLRVWCWAWPYKNTVPWASSSRWLGGSFACSKESYMFFCPPPLIFSSPCLILGEMPPLHCGRGEQVCFIFLHFLFSDEQRLHRALLFSTSLLPFCLLWWQ